MIKKHLLILLLLCTEYSVMAQSRFQRDTVWRPTIEIGADIIGLVRPELKGEITPNHDLFYTPDKPPVSNVFMRLRHPKKWKRSAFRVALGGQFFQFDSLGGDYYPYGRYQNKKKGVWFESKIGYEYHFVQSKRIQLYALAEVGYGFVFSKFQYPDSPTYMAGNYTGDLKLVTKPIWELMRANTNLGVGYAVRIYKRITISSELRLAYDYQEYQNPRIEREELNKKPIPSNLPGESYHFKRTKSSSSLKISPFQNLIVTINI